jgi:hypothetical protein
MHLGTEIESMHLSANWTIRVTAKPCYESSV